MKVRSGLVAASVLVAPLALAACGSTNKPHHHPPTTTITAAPIAQNLIATAAVKASLVAAGAASHNLVSSDYTGLIAGSVFYASDPGTGYWAGASLDPSASSYQAQVSSQDDGSYLLFHKASFNAAWTVYNVGLAGIAGTKCPLTPPAAVLTLWNWKPNSCRWNGA
jgi:hypothetical protein